MAAGPVDLLQLVKLFEPVKPKTNDGSNIPELFVFVINILLYMAGIVLIFSIIIGGIMYITSAGDEAKATKGRASVINGIIGTVIVLLSIVFMGAVNRIFG